MQTLRLAKPVQARVTRDGNTIETEIVELPIREPTFADLLACGDLYTTLTRPDRTMTVERASTCCVLMPSASPATARWC